MPSSIIQQKDRWVWDPSFSSQGSGQEPCIELATVAELMANFFRTQHFIAILSPILCTVVPLGDTVQKELFGEMFLEPIYPRSQDYEGSPAQNLRSSGVNSGRRRGKRT